MQDTENHFFRPLFSAMQQNFFQPRDTPGPVPLPARLLPMPREAPTINGASPLTSSATIPRTPAEMQIGSGDWYCFDPTPDGSYEGACWHTRDNGLQEVWYADWLGNIYN